MIITDKGHFPLNQRFRFEPLKTLATGVFACGLKIPLQNVAPMFSCCFALCDKIYDYEQDFSFSHKMKRKASDKTLEQHFLKEFKATCKNCSEPELKQQNAIRNLT